MNIKPGELIRMILVSKMASPTNQEMVKLMTNDVDPDTLALVGKAALAGEALNHALLQLRAQDTEQLLLITLLGAVAGMSYAHTGVSFNMSETPKIVNTIVKVYEDDFGVDTEITRETVFNYAQEVINGFSLGSQDIHITMNMVEECKATLAAECDTTRH
jgi:hypothetical protein